MRKREGITMREREREREIEREGRTEGGKIVANKH